MSARSPFTHRQVESDVADHRGTVLVHLEGHTVCTAEDLAAANPELAVDRWAAVLDRMARAGEPRCNAAGRSIPPARLLYVVPGWPADEPRYALAMDGWRAARLLTAAGPTYQKEKR